jgi:hypothetical protein
MGKIEVRDDSIEVLIKRQSEPPNSVAVDLLELRMLVEELEAKHPMKREKGMVYATREFLRDLATQLKEIGVEGATPSMAFQLWSKLSEAVEALKKNTLEEQPFAESTESTPSS